MAQATRRLDDAWHLTAPLAPDAPDVAPAPIYVAAALSGFTALGAEVVWTRQLSLLFGASVYTFSLILAVFLTGLGIGGFAGIAPRAPGRARSNALGLIQALLAGAIAFGAWAIVNVLAALAADGAVPPARARDARRWRSRIDALRCAFALLPATILWGASFPLTLAAGRARDFSGHVARINATNTAGALAGAIAFTLIGIPKLGSHDAQQALVIGRGDQRPSLLLWHRANARALPTARRRRASSRSPALVDRARRYPDS